MKYISDKIVQHRDMLIIFSYILTQLSLLLCLLIDTYLWSTPSKPSDYEQKDTDF